MSMPTLSSFLPNMCVCCRPPLAGKPVSDVILSPHCLVRPRLCPTSYAPLPYYTETMSSTWDPVFAKRPLADGHVNFRTTTTTFS